MPGIFKDSAAPYVLVLMISLVGWMFNSALDNARNLRIIEYWTDQGKDGAVDTITFHVANKSMAQAVNSGKFNFICQIDAPTVPPAANTGCLVEMPSVRTKAQYLGSATFGLPEPVQATERGAVTDARIPPGSEIAYRFGLKDSKARLRFRYFLEDADIGGDKSGYQIKILERGADSGGGITARLTDLTLFVIANYLACLVFVMAVLLLFILVYMIAGLIALFLRPKDKPAAPPKITLELTLNGESYVATLERR